MNPQLISLLFIISFHIGYQFNIDTTFPIVYSHVAESYFGYSVLLHEIEANNWWLLVGAPRANQSFSRDIKQPGTLFQCSLKDGSCQEMQIDTSEFPITYKYHDLKDNEWLGGTLNEDSKGTVVTCAHRWKNQLSYQHWRKQQHLYPDQIQDYHSNGLCYTIPKGLKANTAQRHMPLIDRRFQVEDGMPNYCFGMAGMSSHFTEDGKLLLGAPGVFNWEGKLVTIDSLNDRDEDSIVWAPSSTEEKIRNAMYLGYSVTSGKFYSSMPTLSYVVGAPRYRYFGKVYIVKPGPNYAAEFSWEGKHLGEYFGAAVCAIDLNQDGYDELLVGSPFYAVENDEGKVYLFVNKQGNGFEKPIELLGSEAEGARFGTTIAALGDINLDGFPDFAVGAPYEDGKGVVYIYNGGIKPGKDFTISQKLEAKTLNPNLKGFGISISFAKDLDKNHYPDIAIGSYESGQAVILRSQPTVTFHAAVSSSPSTLAIDSLPCEFRGTKVGCLDIKTCIRFESPKTLTSIAVKASLSFDNLMQNQSKRGFFFENGVQSDIITINLKLEGRHDRCQTYQAFLKSNIDNYLTEIEILYEFKLPEQSKDRFCPNCPVLNPKGITSVAHQVYFLNGCGEDKRCNSDLTLKASVIDKQRNLIIKPEIWAGLNKTITFDVSISNSLEAAYHTQLKITIPDWSDFNRKPTTCNDQPPVNNFRFLVCDVGNPLLNKEISFQLYLNVEIMPFDLKELKVDFNVTTTSDEKEELTRDNNVVITIPAKMSADITVYGSTPDEYISYANTSKSNNAHFPFSHVYEVVNLGPSPIDSALVIIDVPEMSKDGVMKFIRNITVQTRDGSNTASVTECRGATTSYLTNEGKDKYNENIPGAVKRRKRATKSDSDDKKNSRLFCEEAKCRKIECDIIKMAPNDGVKIDLLLEIDTLLLDNMKLSGDMIYYTTEAKASILNVPSNIQPPNHKPDAAIVITRFDTGRTSPQELPPWVIPVSIILGTLLLLALAALFYKLGFFTRTQRDALRQAQQEGTPDTTQQPPDNSAAFSSQNNLLESD